MAMNWGRPSSSKEAFVRGDEIRHHGRFLTAPCSVDNFLLVRPEIVELRAL
jgi:hypothetical protein